MTDFSTHPSALVQLLVIVALVLLGVLWLRLVVKHRRNAELAMYERIKSGEMRYSDIRHMTGYNAYVANKIYGGYNRREHAHA